MGLGFISNANPMAWGTTKMSENKMAASVPIWSIGMTVISVASSGVWHRVKKSYFALSFMKSGR